MGRLQFLGNLFSHRQGHQMADPEINQATRARIVRIFIHTYPNRGFSGRSELEDRCAYIQEKMLLAYGQHTLEKPRGNSIAEELLNYVQNCETQTFLEWLEMITEVEDRGLSWGTPPIWNDERLHDLAVEINEAFELGGCHYRLTRFQDTNSSPRIIRTDEPLIQEQAVVPALHALKDTNNASANKALMKALEHQRKGQHSDTARESGNALESVCRELYKKLPNQDIKTAEGNISNIIAALLREYDISTSLVQPIQQVATIRNDNSNAHPRNNCSEELAAYAIGTCCSAIALLLTTAKKRNLS